MSSLKTTESKAQASTCRAFTPSRLASALCDHAATCSAVPVVKAALSDNEQNFRDHVLHSGSWWLRL